MKLLKSIIWTTALAAAVVGCGGGGGSPGGDGKTTLVTTAPADVTLLPSTTQQYVISGGVQPYRVGNGETAIAVGAVSGNKLIIGTVNPGKALVKVFDHANSTVDINVTVGSSVALISTAPKNLLIGVGGAVARNFSIRGGVAPYTVESSQTNAFTAVKQGDDQFRVVGVAIGSGVITITDAAGAVMEISVNVDAPELRVSPTDITTFPGVDAVVKISGGQPPYFVAGGIPDAIEAVIVGDEMRVRAKLATELEVGVQDSAGQIEKVKIKVEIGQAQFGISPARLTIRDDETSPIKLNIYGAADGKVCFIVDKPGIKLPACTNERIVEISPESSGGLPLCLGAQRQVSFTAIDSKGFIGVASIVISGTKDPVPISSPTNCSKN